MSDDIFKDINKYLREEQSSVITDSEIDRLIMAFAVGRGDEGFYEDEVDILIEWAVHTRINNAVLDLALKGLVSLNTEEKKLGTLVDSHGDNISVMITEAGQKYNHLLDN